MKARFIGSGDPGENRVCTVFGQDFPLGEWVDINKASLAKLRGNPTFEVDADGDGKPDLDADALRAELDRMGVTYHHKAGPEKLAELLAKEKAKLAKPEPEPDPEPET